MSKSPIKIGTRDSPLAQWQSKQVKQLLQYKSLESELVLIKSEGDINLTTPLYEMGVQGIFTKTLDTALLNEQIDIAVHSYKDIPTKLAKGLMIGAVLKRGNPFDVLVINRERVFTKEELSFNAGVFSQKKEKASVQITTEQMQKSFSGTLQENEQDATQNFSFKIATSSARRKAQLLYRFKNASIENLRGNVNTRLKKVSESIWHGAVFAAAGLERLGFGHLHTVELDWMLPAPAQGAIAIVCRENDIDAISYCEEINDKHSQICTQVEKDFLRVLMGGCSTPIGAYAIIKNEKIIFKGNILSPDGEKKVELEIERNIEDYKIIGALAAEEILGKGGKEIVEGLQKNSESHEE